LCGENIRTIEEIEKLLVAINWHIAILKIEESIMDKIAIMEIDRKIKDIDIKLARLYYAEES
jgi:hypothetical protein